MALLCLAAAVPAWAPPPAADAEPAPKVRADTTPSVPAGVQFRLIGLTTPPPTTPPPTTAPPTTAPPTTAPPTTKAPPTKAPTPQPPTHSATAGVLPVTGAPPTAIILALAAVLLLIAGMLVRTAWRRRPPL